MKKSLQNTSIYKKKKKKKKKTRLTQEKQNVLLKNTEILNACKNFSQKLYYKNQKTWEMTQKQLSKHIKPKTSESQNKKLVKQT